MGQHKLPRLDSVMLETTLATGQESPPKPACFLIAEGLGSSLRSRFIFALCSDSLRPSGRALLGRRRWRTWQIGGDPPRLRPRTARWPPGRGFR